VESGIEDSLNSDTDVMTMVNAEEQRNEKRLSMFRQGVDPVKAEQILDKKDEKKDTRQAPGCDGSVDGADPASKRGPLGPYNKAQVKQGPAPGVDSGSDTNDASDPYSKGPYTTAQNKQAPGCDVSVDGKPSAEKRGPLGQSFAEQKQAPGCDVSVDNKVGAEIRGPLGPYSFAQ